MYKTVNCLKNYPHYEIISNGDKTYVLNESQWNGEYYSDCWQVEDENGIGNLGNEKNFKPIYKEIGEDEFQLIGYEEIF